jgi:hypothetical protein
VVIVAGGDAKSSANLSLHPQINSMTATVRMDIVENTFFILNTL